MKNKFKIFITALGKKEIYRYLAQQLIISIRTYVKGDYEAVLITDSELSEEDKVMWDDIYYEYDCPKSVSINDWATLGRFERLLKYSYASPDYLIYLDADFLVVDDICLDKLVEGCPEDQYIIPTLHPGYVHTAPEKLPYDWNLSEMSWIKTDPWRYYCGGFQLYRNNEQGRDFLKNLADTTIKYIEEGYIPLWRDESIFNALIPEVKYYLDPSYCMPEDRFEKAHLYKSILHLDPKLIALTK